MYPPQEDTSTEVVWIHTMDLEYEYMTANPTYAIHPVRVCTAVLNRLHFAISFIAFVQCLETIQKISVKVKHGQIIHL